MSLRFLGMLIYAPLACAFAIWRPLWGICALVAMYYFRPDVWNQPSWFRPIMWITVASFAGWLLQGRRVRSGAIQTLAFVTVLMMIPTSFAAAYSSKEAFIATESIFKMIAVQFLILQCCDTLPRLNAFLWANIFGMAWNVKSVLVVGLGGGSIGDRVNLGVAQGGGANYLAMVFAMGLPFFHMKFLNGARWERFYALVFSPLYVICIVLTGSRGGVLATGAAVLWVTLRGNRKIIGILMASVAVVLFLQFMPAEFRERFEKGVSTESEERDFAAQSRVLLWQAGWQMFKENPILGVGNDNYSALSPRYAGFYAGKDIAGYERGKEAKGFVCHSTWFQTLAEGGLVVSLPFFAMFLVSFYQLSRVRRLELGPPKVQHQFLSYAVTLQGGFLAFIAASTFGSHLKVDFMWWYFGAVSALYSIATERHRLILASRQPIRRASPAPRPEPAAPRPAY